MTKTKPRRTEATEREIPPAAPIPSLEDVHPGYGSVLARKRKLQDDLRAAEATVRDARLAVEEAERQRGEVAAQALAAGVDADTTEADAAVVAARRDLGEAERRQVDLERAVSLVEESVTTEHRAAQDALRDRFRQELRESRPRVAALLGELVRFADRQQQLVGAAPGVTGDYVGDFHLWARVRVLDELVDRQARGESTWAT